MNCLLWNSMSVACLLVLLVAICVECKPCHTSHPKRGNLTYYRNKFMFVKDQDPKPLSGKPKANQGPPGSTKCPWTWGIDTNSARKPAVIAVAKCKNCDVIKCKTIMYRHSVLFQRKDCRTGETVWSWKFEEHAIAYVYDV